MKYKCTILRTTYENSVHYFTQPFRRVELQEVTSLFKYVRKLNRRYVKRNIRYTVEVEKQI